MYIGPVPLPTDKDRENPWWPLWSEMERCRILLREDGAGLEKFLSVLHAIDARFYAVMARRQ